MIAFLLALPFAAPCQEKKPQTPQEKIVKERASLLRTAVKGYAIFLSADAAKGEIRIRTEDKGEEKAWALDAEAEIRVSGWSGIPTAPGGRRILDRAGTEEAWNPR